MQEHEAALIRSFVIADKQQRYESKLSSAKHRKAMLDRLNHQFLADLDSRFIVRGKDLWPASQGDCYVLADGSELDQRLLSLAEARGALRDASFGMVVSFIPGKLACYQGEAPAELVWLRRD